MVDWATVGTFGCEECARKRKAFAEAMQRWARNPIGAPRPGTPEFDEEVEKKVREGDDS